MTSTDELAQRLARIERLIASGRVGQLGNSSFEGGGITQYTSDGETVIARYGEQFDGTGGVVGYNGPPPPQPSWDFEDDDSDAIQVGLNSFRVRWGGLFVDGANAPLNLHHIEVHSSPDPDFTGLFATTLRAQITSARGGEVIVAAQPDVEYWFRLVARDSTGQKSIASVPMGPFVAYGADAISGNTIYRQGTAPTGGLLIGDLWLQTPDNVAYRWDGTDWVATRDQGIVDALNDAFDANAAAVAAGAAALAAQNTADTKTANFAQASAPSTSGRTFGDTWTDTDDGNKPYYWNGSAWTAGTLGAAAISATARQLGAITTYRQTSAPTGAVDGDFWLDSDDGNKLYRRESGAWVAVQDTAIQAAITDAATAQATADGKVRIFTQTAAPTGMVAGDVGDMWIDTDDGNKIYTWTGSAWTARQLGNSAIQPNSLVASDVVATGTISAALLEVLFVIANEIVAGDPAGDHARFTPTGIKIFRNDPVDNIPNQVGQLGFGPGDYSGGGDDGHGNLAWNIDEVGVITVAGAVINGDPIIQGRNFTEWLAQANAGGGDGTPNPGARNFYGWADGSISGISTTETGIIEVAVYVQADRVYKVSPQCYYNRTNSGYSLYMRVRDGGSGIPTTSSPLVTDDFYSNGEPGQFTLAQTDRLWRPPTTGVHRLWLTVARTGGAATGTLSIENWRFPTIIVQDMGPWHDNPASVNRGGGGTPVPTQQYYSEMAPAGWTSLRGNGTTRTDTTGPVQGWDPSGFNGDGSGFWWFTLPSITGTVSRVQFYAYSSHWYYNSGGTARVNLVRSGAAHPISTYKVATDMDYGGWTPGGGKTIELPSSVYTKFLNSAGVNRAVGVSVGIIGSTNETFYGRFDGPSARLKIWYTQ